MQPTYQIVTKEIFPGEVAVPLGKASVLCSAIAAVSQRSSSRRLGSEELVCILKAPLLWSRVGVSERL